jgi:hypothetical protein
MLSGRVASIVAALTLAGPVAGCGGGHDFTAPEFVQRINAEGVRVRLGRELESGGNAERLYAVRLPPLPGEPSPPAGSEGGPGASGSLYVFGDAGAAGEQLDACRHAAGLGCFQAENIVVVLDEDSSPLESRRLGVAIERLG